MPTLTKEQRRALYRIYQRGPAWFGPDNYPPTYRAFRRQVRPGFGYVMVPAGNMWLGIEPDGYTHS